MVFQPLKITDKTGQEVILRNAETGDAENLINYLKATTEETPYLIREPDEVTLSLEEEQSFIRRIIASDRELMLIATINGKHIGNCSLMSVGGYRSPPSVRRCDCTVSGVLRQRHRKNDAGNRFKDSERGGL